MTVGLQLCRLCSWFMFPISSKQSTGLAATLETHVS